MRSIDRFRKRDKENKEPPKKPKDKTIDWDFQTNDRIPPKSFPITLDDAEYETDTQRFERYIRQLGRCVLACSLCSRGLKPVTCGHSSRSPHYQPSIWHKEIVLLKFEPDCNDIQGLFKNLDPAIKECGLDPKDFYRTTIVKCPEEHDTGDCVCPYFDMEWKALLKCKPKLIICLDTASIEWIGGNSMPNKFQSINGMKTYYPGDHLDRLIPLFKILANPQTRSRLI